LITLNLDLIYSARASTLEIFLFNFGAAGLNAGAFFFKLLGILKRLPSSSSSSSAAYSYFSPITGSVF